ncbi:MAG: Hsp33 family molecular chaperone HslO [Acidobacteriota bacterium]
MSASPPLFEDRQTDASGTLRLGLAAHGELRWAATDLTGPMEHLRRRIDLGPTAAVAVARAASSAVLLLRFDTKLPGKLRLEVKGDGPLGHIVVEVDHEGLLRASVDEPHFAGFDPERLEIGRAVGSGLLRVTQEVRGREPYASQVALVDGEIGNDLVHFLRQSRQVRSAALLGVLPGPNGLAAAGGMLIEALPGATDESVQTLEERIAALGGVGAALDERGVDGLVDSLFDGVDHVELERQAVIHGCRCSREALVERLRTVPIDDLRELAAADGTAEIECAFCAGSFVFSLDELSDEIPS